MTRLARAPTRQRGFTVIELILVIVVLGVVGGMVAVFMRAPVDAYVATSRRASLSDVADTAMRRMARDMRKALPNSIRLSGASGAVQSCLEFIPTRTGVRYRENDKVAGDGLGLRFDAPDATFNFLGRNADRPADQQVRPYDLLAVYNLGIPAADAYRGDNVAVVRALRADTSVPASEETTVELQAPVRLPLASGSRRAHVIPVEENVVAFVCTGTTLRRVVTPGSTVGSTPRLQAAAGHYCNAAEQPASSAPLLATGVTYCAFDYQPDSDAQRNGLVKIELRLGSEDGESVSLYQNIQVNNTP